jgi:hypothetical protein
VGNALTELYTSSEGAVKLIIRGDDWLAHPGSVGKPRGGDEIKILDDDGNETPAEIIGNVYMRSNGDRDFEYKGAERTDAVDGSTRSATWVMSTPRATFISPTIARIASCALAPTSSPPKSKQYSRYSPR